MLEQSTSSHTIVTIVPELKIKVSEMKILIKGHWLCQKGHPKLTNGVPLVKGFLPEEVELQYLFGHPFLAGKDTGDELATRGAMLQISTVPCKSLFSHLLSNPLVSFLRHEAYCLFKFFTLGFPSNLLENWCFPKSPAVTSLVFASKGSVLC